uniref:Putative conserved secreted protein n=1 Tax=Ornithodoros turicata TaxID=34597 RepID=A0A2R5LH20_9ACAR
MGKRLLSFASLCSAAIAILYSIEVEKNKWVTSKSITLKAKLTDAFSFVTTADYMNKWLPFVSYVREADGKQMGIGKKYRATYEFPILGEYDMMYRVVDYAPRKNVIVESDFFLRPHVEFHFFETKEDECRMEVRLSFRRFSYLYQYSLGPILHFLAGQQLQRSLFLLRMVFPY